MSILEPDHPVEKKIKRVAVPDHYRSEVESIIKLLKAMEDSPNTYTDFAHNRTHKTCRRMFQNLLEMDY